MSATIGFGGGHLDRLGDTDAEALLRGVLDLGVELIDTARSYGRSEELIGRFVGERDGVVVSTKVGYGVDGHQDWTPGCITAGIDQARRRLRREVIDIVALHSCPLSTLESDGVLDALLAAREAGRIRQVAYSGDNAELGWALSSGAFDVIQTSVNVCDSSALDRIAGAPVTVLAKRGLANAVWRFESRPDAHDLGPYWDRWQEIGPHLEGDRAEQALRFTANAPGVDVVLVGTSTLHHLEAAIRAASLGPLPPATEAAIRRTGARWPQIT